MKILSAGLATLIILSGCIHKPEEYGGGLNTSLIQGVIENGQNKIVYIQQINPEAFLTMDSIIIGPDSKFQTKIPIDYPGFYAIKNENGDYITILCKGADTVEVFSNYYNFNDYDLKGSTELQEIARLNSRTQAFLNEISEYARIISDSVGSENYVLIKQDLDAKYRAAFNDLKRFSTDFIYRNQGSLISLLALTNQLGVDFFVFHPLKDLDIFLKTDSLLMLNYPESEAVRGMHSRLERIKLETNEVRRKLSPGEPVPGFTLKDPDNNQIGLADFHGKVILLNFWASWSPPSREYSSVLKNLNKQFGDKGLVILQISLDKEYEPWVNAINEDKLKWNHASELKFWDSDVAREYGVESLPASFLIDDNGKLISTEVSQESLTADLEKILNRV